MSMTYGQLLESVQFQAGIPDIDTLGAWLEQELNRTCDELTGAIKYPQLYVDNFEVVIGFPGDESFILPTDFQRLDMESVRWYPGGVQEDGYYLTLKHKPEGLNEGDPRYFSWRLGFIDVFPFAETTALSKVVFNYWRKFYRLGFTDDDEEIQPAEIGNTILHEMVAKATAIMGDSKRFQMATALGQRSYSRSFGVTPQPDC